MPKVLFVDDETHVTEAFKRALRQEPYEILTANSAQDALTLMAQQSVDVLIADEKMPGMSGTELVSAVRRIHPSTIRIMLTGHATLEAAVRVINEGGIHRFLLKPFSDVELARVIRDALEQRHVVEETKQLLDTFSASCKWLKANLTTLHQPFDQFDEGTPSNPPDASSRRMSAKGGSGDGSL